MFDYLQQFNSLPQDLKDKVSSPEAMSFLSEIESRYRVDLAMVIMKVMIKTLTLKELPLIFASEFGLAPEQAENMTQELKSKIFAPVADYVGISSEMRSLDLNKDINLLIKESGLSIPSEFLIERFKKILATYLRGVRNRIDTRASLAKDIATGGLNLSALEIDRVLKVCDGHNYKYNGETEATFKSPEPLSRLDKIISSSEPAISGKVNAPSGEYDLKKALASGETKSIAAPEPILELEPGHQGISKEQKTLSETDSRVNFKHKDPVVKNSVVEESAKVVAPVVTEAQSKMIVQKPEVKTNNLIKRLFADNDNQTTKGSIRIANVSEDTGANVNSFVPTPPVSAPQVSQKLDSKSKPKTDIASARAASSQPKVDSGRKQMHDVKPVPKIMGPLEELQFLDLMNFRRLGKTPDEIIAKIFNKIKLLEHDGYEKMIQGIGAWRKSPVSRLYLKMVQDAVSANLPLKEAIIASEGRGEDVLSLAEIEAIMSLNSKLVF